jgi:hypothetical protein
MENVMVAVFVVLTFVTVYWLLAASRPGRPRDLQRRFLHRARHLIRISIERAAHRDVHWLTARERDRHL